MESKARGLWQSGVSAFQEGRFQDAAVDLREASERFGALRTSRPNDPTLVRLHATCLGFLAGSLRDSKRPVEALARFRKSLAAYESLANPNPGDLYNMACDCAMVAALDERGSPEGREKLLARAVVYLRRAIAGDMALFLPQVATDRDLDPLRRRADFKGMIADARFPIDPFAQSSPLALPMATPGELKIRGEALIARGRTRDALPYLASALKDNPGDSFLLFRVAALQAWFHRDAELAATGRKAREFARGTKLSLVADSAAKSSSLLPTDHPTDRAATLALARSAYELGKDEPIAVWYRMGLGIAECRAGHDVAAAEVLRPLIGDDSTISATSAFYLVMSLSRQGKDDEARKLAVEAEAKMKPLPSDERNPLAGGASHDDLILWLAYKEAKSLIGWTSNPVKLREEAVALKKAKPGPDTPAGANVLPNALTAAGRTPEAIAILEERSASNPKDMLASLTIAALRVWLGQEEEFAAIRRQALALAKGTNDVVLAERVAKLSSLLPSPDRAELDAALALGRTAAKPGDEAPYRPYRLLALGMAAYRGGDDKACDEALLAAGEAGKSIPLVTGTAVFYRAMSLHRRGRIEEARKLATETAATMKPLPADDKNPLVGGLNHDHLILWLAYKEAKALIGFDAPAAAPPKPDGK